MLTKSAGNLRSLLIIFATGNTGRVIKSSLPLWSVLHPKVLLIIPTRHTVIGIKVIYTLFLGIQ